jgi:myxalamid-type polyketide synthase MxaE and MxaD
LLAEFTATDAARSRLNEIDIIQPALFAIEVALAALWRSWGIEPQAVVGHSLGEVAAAYVAGALSLDDAVRVICHRSRLFKRTIGQGAMAVVELSIEEARRVLVGFEDRVSIAVSNGPTSTVLSGDPAALAAILDTLQRRDIFCRMVKVDVASHSPQMDPLRADLLQALEGLQPRAESVPIYSTVTGQFSHGLEFDPLYWARNMREPVLFSTAIQRLVEDGHDIFLEISPHPILLSAMQQGFNHFGQEAAGLPSLRREEDEHTVLLGSLGALYTLGYPVDWNLIYPTGGRCVRLPFYPWQRERCWLEPSAGDTDSHREQVSRSETGNHPLLRRHFKSAHPEGTHFWETTLDKNSLPYLDDHRIQGVAVLPASAYVEMGLAAAVEVFGAQSVALKDIEFRKAFFLPEGGTRTIQVILSQGADGAASFHIYSCPGGVVHSGKSWMLHATGKVCLQHDNSIITPVAGPETLTEMRTRGAENISGQDYYRRLRESGIHYGPFFQSIAQLWRNNGDVLGEVQVPDGPEAEFNGFQIHPAILDAGLQVLGAAVAAEATENGRQRIYLPTRIGQFRVHGRPGRHLWSHTRVQHREADATTGEVQLLDEAGRVAVEIQGLRFEFLGEDTPRVAVDNLDDWLYEFQWQPKERPEGKPSTPASRASWLIFTDNGGVGNALSALLEARGEWSILVAAGESYEQTDSEHFRIRPERPEDIRRLFEVALVSDQPGCRGIVHLWSLDAARPEETTVASLNAAQTMGCGSILLLVQELARMESPDLPRLWLITQGAQAAGEKPAPLSVAQSPLWGLGRVIAQEHPTFWGGLVDLEPGHPASRDAAAHQLWEEISPACGTDGEDQLAFRQGRRYVARLVRQRPSATPAPPLRWRTDGSYLISGGLGDLGLLVARWMVEQGARRLILLGRTKVPPRSNWSSVETGSRLARQITAIRELESLGACVHLASVDVADEGELSGFLDEFRAEGWPPIRGVVHAAGVLQDGLLVQLDAAALNTVLRPKVMGGWLLHRLLRDDPLDFFVLFSSAGSVLGQPGQGNYAAANAFLDALAHRRQAQGQPALSINWGAWAGEGFADSVGGKRLAARLARLGISSIAPRQALEMLGRLLGQSATQVVAVPVNWKQYREFYPAGSASPLLSELACEEAEVPRPTGRTSERRDALLAAEPAERRQLLQSYLGEQVARVLGLSPSKLDVQQPLSNLGLDSLMAVELKNRIAVDLKVNVPVVKFLQGFSVDQAVTQVLDQLAAEAANPTTPLPPAVAQPGEQRNAERLLASLDQLSDEKVDSLLTDMLGEEKVGE